MNTVLIRYRGLRRALGAILVALGALLMWLAPEVWSGVVLLAAGIALEAAGAINRLYFRSTSSGTGYKT